MKPKDAIKLDTIHWRKHSQKKPYYVRMVYTHIYINLVNNMGIKNDGQKTLSGVKIRINWIKFYKNQVIVSHTIYKTDPIDPLCVKN